ncbi:hypothetical protein OUZ56_006072 [Daphnia magna]|uniref:Uncharacterized protein n=1 Tax=Daphnia magna TaxID=35525 RepID=A0ABQ9YUK6_9CRUS|nr:hypothetical protein OUZ56_006072 [Daphnia magna]
MDGQSSVFQSIVSYKDAIKQPMVQKNHDGDVIVETDGWWLAATRLLVVLLGAIVGSAGRSFCVANAGTPENRCWETVNRGLCLVDDEVRSLVW